MSSLLKSKADFFCKKNGFIHHKDSDMAEKSWHCFWRKNIFFVPLHRQDKN